jgi:hypothetical protein
LASEYLSCIINVHLDEISGKSVVQTTDMGYNWMKERITIADVIYSVGMVRVCINDMSF